ncbi:hypothetical protein BDW60DRAFT_195803 [Aspergillus nidulans var. acristatus]
MPPGPQRHNQDWIAEPSTVASANVNIPGANKNHKIKGNRNLTAPTLRFIQLRLTRLARALSGPTS